MTTAIGKKVRFGADKMMNVISETILIDNTQFYSRVTLEGKKGKQYIGFRRHDGSYKRI